MVIISNNYKAPLPSIATSESSKRMEIYEKTTSKYIYFVHVISNYLLEYAHNDLSTQLLIPHTQEISFEVGTEICICNVYLNAFPI